MVRFDDHRKLESGHAVCVGKSETGTWRIRSIESPPGYDWGFAIPRKDRLDVWARRFDSADSAYVCVHDLLSV